MATIIITNTGDDNIYIVNHRGIGTYIQGNSDYTMILTYAVEGESKSYLESYYTSLCNSINTSLEADYLSVVFDIPSDWGSDVPVMRGATAELAGSSGTVPVPLAGQQDKVLKGDGTWGDVPLPDLADVATSGSYLDLQDKPSLSTVATSGSYSDLKNTPTLGTQVTYSLSGTTLTITTK